MIVGMAGVIVLTTFISLIVNPVFASMYEDIFLQIGGNINRWGKNLFGFIFLENYKHYTLSKGLFKIDLIINFLFAMTLIFIWISIPVEKSALILTIVIIFTLLAFGNNFHGHFMVPICFKLAD